MAEAAAPPLEPQSLGESLLISGESLEVEPTSPVSPVPVRVPEPSEDGPKRGHSFKSCLNALSNHSRGRREANRSRRLLVSHLQVAVLVGFWTLILSSPIIIWPLGEFSWDYGCSQHDILNCLAAPDCAWAWSPPHCVANTAGFLTLWGSMIMQFLFSVYLDYGSSVKFAIQGFTGTLMATLNVLVMNNAFGSWLHGGARADSPQSTSSTIPANSAWLPLCNDGHYALENTGHFCFLNIAWSHITLMGSMKSLFVLTDFIVFTAVVLMSGFSNNTRMFALSIHCYFMMSFVDPSREDFMHQPTAPVQYIAMVAFASLASVLVFWLPQCRKRFTALDAAGQLAAEVSEACGLLVESMLVLQTELMCQKAACALEETKAMLDEFEEKVEYSWFEDFGRNLRGCCSGSREYRRKYRRLAACARSSVVHIPSVHFTAAMLSPADWQKLNKHAEHGLTEACLCARDLLVVETAEEDLLQWRGNLATASADFEKVRLELSPEARTFLFTVYAVLNDVRVAVESREDEAAQATQTYYSMLSCLSAIRRFVRTVSDKFHFEAMGRDPTQPRFVLRNTFSITLAFFLGWIGLWNVLPAYSYYAANTMSLILYTYTGSSTPITIKRVAGVVLGKVTGTMVQLAFACKSTGTMLAYAFCMWSIVTFLFFLYLHMDQDMAYVASLAVAFAASAMIPASFKLRECSTYSMTELAPSLLNTIIATVIGVIIMTVMDLLLGSSATLQANQRLISVVRRVGRFLTRVGTDDWQVTECKLKDDLDKLKDLLPYAASEPTVAFVSLRNPCSGLLHWRKPFKADLYKELERRVRRIAKHAEELSWALRIHARWESQYQSEEQPTLSRNTSIETGAGSRLYEWTSLRNDERFALPMKRCSVELVRSLAAVEQLVAQVTAADRGEPEADVADTEHLWDQMANSLYTVRALRSIANGTANVLQKTGQHLRRRSSVAADPLKGDLSSSVISSNSADALPSFKGSAGSKTKPQEPAVPGLTRVTSSASNGSAGSQSNPKHRGSAGMGFLRQAFNEHLTVPSFGLDLNAPCPEEAPQQPAALCAAAGARQHLESLLQALRQSGDPVEGRLPNTDDLCRVEFVVVLVSAVALEISKMQLALLEYAPSIEPSD